jgi:hypothetical protein
LMSLPRDSIWRNGGGCGLRCWLSVSSLIVYATPCGSRSKEYSSGSWCDTSIEMLRCSTCARSYVSTLGSPDKSMIVLFSLPCAEFAKSESTSRIEVLPVPLAPIITQSGRSGSATFCSRLKPWIERFVKRIGELFGGLMGLISILSVPTFRVGHDCQGCYDKH